jgi:hypothetical protein
MFANVDQSVFNAESSQSRQHAVGRKTLRDAVECDRHAGFLQSNAVVLHFHGLPIDTRACRCHFGFGREAILSLRRGECFPQRLHGHVECTIGFARHRHRAPEHIDEKRMRRVKPCVAIQPADLAFRLIDAEQPAFEKQEFGEGSTNRAIGPGRVGMARHNRNLGAERSAVAPYRGKCRFAS